MNEAEIINLAVSSAASASAVVISGVVLLKKMLADNAKSIERTERLLEEYHSECQTRAGKSQAEYMQIIASLNEIKIEIARTESLRRLEKILNVCED